MVMTRWQSNRNNRCERIQMDRFSDDSNAFQTFHHMKNNEVIRSNKEIMRRLELNRGCWTWTGKMGNWRGGWRPFPKRYQMVRKRTVKTSETSRWVRSDSDWSPWPLHSSTSTAHAKKNPDDNPTTASTPAMASPKSILSKTQWQMGFLCRKYCRRKCHSL